MEICKKCTPYLEYELMKTLKVIVLTLATIAICVGIGWRVYVHTNRPKSIEAIRFKIIPEWVETYGGGDQSQRDYDIWALSQTSNRQAKLIAALLLKASIDPNEVK